MKESKKDVRKSYVSPACVVVPMNVSSIICTSGNVGVTNVTNYGNDEDELP